MHRIQQSIKILFDATAKSLTINVQYFSKDICDLVQLNLEQLGICNMWTQRSTHMYTTRYDIYYYAIQKIHVYKSNTLNCEH